MATLKDKGLRPSAEYVGALKRWADAVEITEAGAAAQIMREASVVIENLVSELDNLNSGAAVVLPASRKHAEAMHVVATAMLDPKPE